VSSLSRPLTARQTPAPPLRARAHQSAISAVLARTASLSAMNLQDDNGRGSTIGQSVSSMIRCACALGSVVACAALPTASTSAVPGIELAATETNESASVINGRVAFIVKRGRVEAIAVRPLMGGASRLVSAPRFLGRPVAVRSISWAPGGADFAFSDSAGRVYVVGATGGPRRIARRLEVGGRDVFVSGWSPNGRMLAVATSARCTAGEPHLIIVRVDSGRVTRLPAHPEGAPPASALHPAFIAITDWSPDGSRLLYAWKQFYEECRGIGYQGTRVLTIGVDGKGRREVATSGAFVVDAIWSPSGELIALADQCSESRDVPFAWRANNVGVVIATSSACPISIVDRRGNRRAKFEVDPFQAYRSTSDGYGTVVFALDAATSKVRTLRKVGAGVTADALGTMTGARGVVARLYRDYEDTRLALIPLVDAPLVSLPPLRPPKGFALRTGPEVLAAAASAR
jgi:dipeptidyl aminopeptidase/acylaminoacyl peptidase